jgi:serine/threonine protein kinase
VLVDGRTISKVADGASFWVRESSRCWHWIYWCCDICHTPTKWRFSKHACFILLSLPLNPNKVAIKTLSKHLYEVNQLAYPPFEVEFASKLVHTKLVTLLDVIVEEDHTFLVQEFLSGGDLYTSMQEIGLFSEFLARCLFNDLLAGVMYLHEERIVHRDIKPENCVLDGNGTLKMIDFGMAACFVPGQLFEDYCGSTEYAAPEIIREIPYEGPPVDVWALGAVLYDMVMGDIPFPSGSSHFELRLENISVELGHLLERMLDEQASERACTDMILKCHGQTTPLITKHHQYN